MSGISGSGGAARRAIHEFDEALDDASAPGTTSQEKVSKSEMREALKELKPVQGHMTAKTRADVWAKINEHALTPTAKALAEATVGPQPAAAGLPKDGPKLAKHLEGLAKDLTFMSESDYPYKAFSKPLAPSAKLDDAALKKAFGLAPGAQIEKSDIADWFKDRKDPQVEDDAATRAKYAAVEAAMKAGLKDLQMVYGGPQDQVDAKVYLIGRAPDGSIAGLVSRRIWT